MLRSLLGNLLVRSLLMQFQKEFPTMSSYPQVPQQIPSFDPAFVTSALELPGYRIVRNYGIVRGIVVRSRNLLAKFGASVQTILGGNITLFSELCERTRVDAYQMMVQHAAQVGANAVISFRYDATELMNGVTEVLAYGTAVYVEKI